VSLRIPYGAVKNRGSQRHANAKLPESTGTRIIQNSMQKRGRERLSRFQNVKGQKVLDADSLIVIGTEITQEVPHGQLHQGVEE
jgi:hypothetical protein